jgi:hypothetical protein
MVQILPQAGLLLKVICLDSSIGPCFLLPQHFPVRKRESTSAQAREQELEETTANPLEGFLFLCPPKDFQIGPSSFKWPDCAAYWSLDPFGADPLSLEDAANLGFPSLRPCTIVFGRSWDASVYAGLRQLHQAKGFDPDTQDVARHLGQPLYGLSGEITVPFAHSESTVCTQLISHS